MSLQFIATGVRAYHIVAAPEVRQAWTTIGATLAQPVAVALAWCNRQDRYDSAQPILSICSLGLIYVYASIASRGVRKHKIEGARGVLVSAP